MSEEAKNTGPLHLWSQAGIIVVDKPRGPSSHEVAAWVGKMLGCQVGHAGTLDPQVSGVLLVMIGNAVRLAPLLLQHDKEYICLMRLHNDAEEDKIRKMAEEFTGRLYQRPPRKSAVKRALRIREIRKIEILDIDERLVLFRVECDAGTYIRSLCHHMGLALGVGAHMVELRRTRSGTFGEEGMHILQDIQDAAVAVKAGDTDTLQSLILSVDAAIPEVPIVVIRDTAIDAVCRGAKLAGVGVISCDEFKKDETVAVLSQKKEFVCLGKALVPSTAFKPGDTGIVISPTSVFLRPGTYPRGWTKSGKIFTARKKQDTESAPKPDKRPERKFRKKRYH
jgi:tRNA pseudouridine55 synthase/H/ACA ribonucleoprotein complex subunit 4